MSAAASAGPAFPRLDKYELLEEIGHGGMATVYRARDPRLGREVAVKLIHRHLRENAEVGTRFVAEARAAAKLRHPGIVDVFDVSNEDDAERYLVAELIRGTTLRKVLLAHRDMPAEVGAAIVAQLCEAVEHAHALSIIHRDIKPENVLVELPSDRLACTPQPPPTDDHEAPASGPELASAPTHGADDGSDHAGFSSPDAASLGDGDTQSSPREAMTPRGLHARPARPRKPARRDGGPKARVADPGVVIKITDFGIAKILDAQGVTSTGQVLGSPAHMAPEQIEGGDVDARTDVFALGVLLYECLVGHLPFEGKNPAQVLRRVLEGAFAPADRERPSTGGRWASIVAAALAHDPAQRIGSASELGERIQAELEALGLPDPRAEIAAYFADPAGYVETHKALVVPRLTARGEAARKAGDVWGAAADWNRALALAPDDLAILKRIAGLTSSAGRRILLRRAAMIVAGSAALGLGAFAVARSLKARAAVADVAADAGPAGGGPQAPGATTTVLGEAVVVAPRADGSGLPIAPAPRPSTSAVLATPPTSVVRTPATPGFTPAPPPPAPPATRSVSFTVRPKGARLSIDGVERNWFTAAMQLSVGTHSVEATPTDPRCCRKTAGFVIVHAPPADRPNEVESVVFAMDIIPARVGLAVSAPKGAQIYCADIGLNVPAGTIVEAKLRDPDWGGTCTFSAPSMAQRMRNVSLKAGESKTIPWPE